MTSAAAAALAPMAALTVDALAQTLQEPNRPLLALILRRLGPARTLDFLTQTLHCEAQGGLLTTNGARRRTPGGTFLYLVRTALLPGVERNPFPWQRALRPPPPPPPVPAVWADLTPVWQALALLPTGKASMKTTLIGLPTTVEYQGDCVLFCLEGTPPPALPKALPPVTATAPLVWQVVVGRQQWARVEPSLRRSKDDRLILEGYPTLQDGRLVLLVQQCQSVAGQRARQQQQQQAARPPKPARKETTP
jgi:PHAX RNA-binding domain